MRDKIRNAIFKIEAGIKNLLTALEEISLQILRHAITNGYNSTVQMIHKLHGCIAERFMDHISNNNTLTSIYNE